MKSEGAFSLTEVVLALGISAFCLLVLLGLLPVGLNSNQSSREETSALNIASRMIADLQSIPKGKAAGGANQAVDGLSIPEAGENGGTQTVYYTETPSDLDRTHNFQSSPDNNTRFRITATLTPPASASGTAQHTATCVHLLVSWPPHTDPATTRPAGSVATFVALDRN